MGSTMDGRSFWSYVWAYWRTADRWKSRSHRPEGYRVANALVKLAAAEYDDSHVGKEPTNLRVSNYGYLPERRTAWFSRNALASVIRSDASMTVPANPRLLFDSGRNFYKNTTQFGIAGYDDAVGRRESVLHEDDVNGFREHFGRSSRLPRWQGRVIAGHGVPRNVSWIAIVDKAWVFTLSPEERAVECAGMIRLFPSPPALRWAPGGSSAHEVFEAMLVGGDLFSNYALQAWPVVARARGAEAVTQDGNVLHARIRLDGWRNVAFCCLAGQVNKAAGLYEQMEKAWGGKHRAEALVVCGNSRWPFLLDVVRRAIARRPSFLPVYLLDVDTLIFYIAQQPWCDYQEFAHLGIVASSDESFSEQLAAAFIAMHIASGAAEVSYESVKAAFKRLKCGDFPRALENLRQHELLFRDGDVVRGAILQVARHKRSPSWFETTRAGIAAPP